MAGPAPHRPIHAFVSNVVVPCLRERGYGARPTAHGKAIVHALHSWSWTVDKMSLKNQDVLSVNDGQWYAQLMGWETRKMHLLHLLYRGKKVFSSLTRQQMWLTYDNGGT